MRLVILGGGGFRVPLVHRALSRRPELGVDELVLFDVDPVRLSVIEAVLPPAPGIRVRATANLADALRGADFVFSAIRVGGPQGRVRDERRALDLGVLGQETVGAGGLAYGLRTLPVALEYARAQAEFAPDSWLINFTNPAGLITQALSEVLGPKVIGICDSPIGLVGRACRALGIPISDAEFDYAGINHLGWLRSLSYHGVDRLPDLLRDDAALETMEEGRLFGPAILRSLGLVPNEYVYFYDHAREIAASLAVSLTRGEVVAAEQQEFYRAAAGAAGVAAQLWESTRLHREQTYLAETRTATDHRDEEDLSGGGYQEVALDLIGALTGQSPATLIVNAPNGSAIAGLPADTVIETLCRVDSAGARPLPVRDLDLYQLGLIASVRAAEQAVISAVVGHSRREAVRAFAIHPLIGSWEIAEQLVSGLLTDEPSMADLLR